MTVPVSTAWNDREVVTAASMNSRVRDMHTFLYAPPACRLTGWQYGSPPSGTPAPPTGCLSPKTTFPASAWKTFPFHPAGHGVRPTNEFDNTGGLMAIPGASGAVWAITAPVPGIYEVMFSGVGETVVTATEAHFRLGIDILEDSDFGAGGIGDEGGGKVSTTRFYGDISTTIPLKAGDTVSAGLAMNEPFYMGDENLPDRTYMSVRWIGRYPS